MPLENELEATRRQVTREIEAMVQEICVDWDIEPHTLLVEISWEPDN